MPQITNSPGPLFESSDDVTMGHNYAQKTDECSAALPEATPGSLNLGKEITVASDCAPVSMDSSPLPDATDNKLPDETNSLQPLCSSLPDTTGNPGQDATDATDSGVLDAMVEYPLSVTNTKELSDKTVNEQEQPSNTELLDVTDSEQVQLPNMESPEDNAHLNTGNKSARGDSTVDNKIANDVSNVDSDSTVSQNLLENSIPLESTNDKSDVSRLNDCIIKLTDLSAEERNMWLGLSEKGSSPNVSSDSNKSRYYMRKCEDPPKE